MTAAAKRIIITGVSMIVVMAVAVAAVWIGLNRRYKAPSPMRCLPTETAVVVRLGDRAAIAERTADPIYGQELTDALGGLAVRQMAARVDTLFGHGVLEDPPLSGRDIYVSFMLTDNGEMRQLAASFRLNNRMEWHKAMNALRDREGIEVKDTSVVGHGLFLLREEGNSEPLYMAAGGGCLFTSTTPDLLVSFGNDSITPMCDDPQFAQIERTVSSSAAASIFINAKYALAVPADKNPITGQFANTILLEGHGSDWMAFDLSLHDDGLSADGFATSQHPTLAMLSSRENTSALGLARRIPKGVTRFIRIGAGRRGLSSPSFTDFLGQDTIGKRYRNTQSDIFAKTNVDIEALISQVFEPELAFCDYGNASIQDSVTTQSGAFLVVDTHGGTKAHATLTQALTAMHGGTPPMVIGEIQPGASAVPAGVSSLRSDAEQVSDVSIPVYGGFESNDETFFLNMLFGHRIPARVFFRYEDALVFADDMGTLRRVLADYVTGNTMEGDTKFGNLMSHFGNDCSTFTYETEPEHNPSYGRRRGHKTFGTICHMMTRAGSLPYISIFAQNASDEEADDVKAGADVTWQTRLDSIRGGKLWSVTNHYTQLTECLAQDMDNKVCLVGADGMLLWRRPVDSPIVGEVSQVDFYANGKLQYLFTTEKSLYIIDRLGNDVGTFPVALPSPAQSGATSALYSDGSPIRFFVGCKNGPVVFGPDGKQVDGWKAAKPEGEMRSAPQHFVCSQKDYIVYHDKYAYYYVDRRGNKRLSTSPLAPGDKSQMAVSANGRHFVTTTSDGTPVFINGENGHIVSLKTDSIGGDIAALPLASNTYAVIGTRRALVVDTDGDTPTERAQWITGYKSVTQVKALDGLIVAFDAKASLAHIYSSIDGSEVSASPFEAHGSVALGHGTNGIVAMTLGNSGEIVQIRLTKGTGK